MTLAGWNSKGGFTYPDNFIDGPVLLAVPTQLLKKFLHMSSISVRTWTGGEYRTKDTSTCQRGWQARGTVTAADFRRYRTAQKAGLQQREVRMTTVPRSVAVDGKERLKRIRICGIRRDSVPLIV
jgi:hypothetical protein